LIANILTIRPQTPNSGGYDLISGSPKLGGWGAIASVYQPNTKFTPHNPSVTAEHTECKPDNRNAIAAHSICTAKHPECTDHTTNFKHDNPSVTTKHPECPDYTTNVTRNNPSVTTQHPKFPSPLLNSQFSIPNSIAPLENRPRIRYAKTQRCDRASEPRNLSTEGKCCEHLPTAKPHALISPAGTAGLLYHVDIKSPPTQRFIRGAA
jgi:hypothetical protein